MAFDFDHYPPSPTLTNPDMILPALYASSPSRSPSRYSETKSLAVSDLTQYHSAPVSPVPTSPSILVRPSSPLPAIEEVDTTPRRPLYNTDPTLASSPILRTLGDPVGWPLQETRRLSGMSNGSSSVHSEDLEKWKPAHTTNDAYGPMGDDDEDKFDQFPKQSECDDEAEGESWLPAKEDDETEDFLSRRAEIILANAKKRLNLMEGNLKGARHSLSSTGLSSHYYASQRARQSYITSKQQSTPGHSRAASEASVPSPVPSLPTTTTRPTGMPKRASSALGSFASLGVNDRTTTTSTNAVSLRGARSQEAMRESRLKHWILDDRTVVAPMDLARSVSSTGHHYVASGSPTPSADMPRRPASQASEIRAQMNELRDRISEIKERAKESSKRASTLSLRTTSPMSSENSHATPDHLKSTAASVVNRKSVSPGQSPKSPDLAVKNPPKPYSPSQDGFDEVEDYAESYYDDAEETLDDLEDKLQQRGPHSTVQDNSLQQHQIVQETLMGDVLEELPEELDGDEIEDIGSISGETEYFEAEQVMVLERHEDRLDAFDYENFFLHSAMGTYSRNQRRDSFGSESSVETTRPASPLRTAESLDPERGVTEADSSESQASPLAAVHRRNMSMESISTTASFQTATQEADEDFDYEEGLEYDDLDAITDQVITATIYSPSKVALHSRQSMSPRKHPGPSPLVPLPSPPAMLMPTSPVGMKQSRPSSGLLSSFIGLDALDSVPDIVHRDRALVEGVVSALQRCCLELQRSMNGKREDWRERLTEAKRILEGLEEEEHNDDDDDEGF